MAKKFICRPDYPVVKTKAGKVRGYVLDDTFIFKGIPYAYAERFCEPEETAAWEGIRDAQSYGMVCPLMEQDNPTMELKVPHMYWPMDEHCQNLNIWTQSLEPEAKKPVMVWLHGGGFFAGSSIEQIAYEGENMSKYGDVVVVSLNHRLNVLGYLDLSPFGEKYKHSANLGTADIVAALRWVKENIAGFGGDPDNVTIFGQSGGGAKVWTLLQTPAADGLYHKGIIQSGVYDLRYDVPESSGKTIVEAMLKELGLTVDEVEKLEKIPYAELAAAYQKALPEIAAQGAYTGNEPHAGIDYAGDPVKVGFREETRKIPLIIGTALAEFDFGAGITGKRQLTDEQIVAMVKEKYGEEGEALLPVFKEAYPDKHVSEVLNVDTIFRAPTIEFIKERVKAEESKVYSYQFTYEFPVDDGKMAWHCSEIPFVFHNADKVPICNKEGETDELQEAVFGAWMSFAKTGKPVIAGTEWPESRPGDEAVMTLDVNCRIRHNVDHELISLLKKTGNQVNLKNSEIQH